MKTKAHALTIFTFGATLLLAPAQTSQTAQAVPGVPAPPALSSTEQTIKDIKNPVPWFSWGADFRAEPYTQIIRPRLLIPRQASSPEWTSL